MASNESSARCDICCANGHGTIVSPEAFQDAVFVGHFDPFSAGLFPRQILEASGQSAAQAYENWLQLVRDNETDWSVCPNCYAGIKSFLRPVTSKSGSDKRASALHSLEKVDDPMVRMMLQPLIDAERCAGGFSQDAAKTFPENAKARLPGDQTQTTQETKSVIPGSTKSTDQTFKWLFRQIFTFPLPMYEALFSDKGPRERIIANLIVYPCLPLYWLSVYFLIQAYNEGKLPLLWGGWNGESLLFAIFLSVPLGGLIGVLLIYYLIIGPFKVIWFIGDKLSKAPIKLTLAKIGNQWKGTNMKELNARAAGLIKATSKPTVAESGDQWKSTNMKELKARAAGLKPFQKYRGI